MTITLPESKDIKTRDLLMKSSSEVLDKEIKRIAKKLNNRIARLEKADLDKYVPGAVQNIKNFIGLTNSGDKVRFSYDTREMTHKEKATYLTRLFHFETYKLNVSQVKEIKEKNRKTIEVKTGGTVTDEQMDRVGELMRDVYRNEDSAGALFRELFDSDSARQWAIENRDMTEEELQEFLNMLENLYEDHRKDPSMTMQDAKDIIDAFRINDGSTTTVIDGVTFDILTGHPINEVTGAILEDYVYEATSETLRGIDDTIANVDKETGQIIPIKEFLEFIYGNITK